MKKHRKKKKKKERRTRITTNDDKKSIFIIYPHMSEESEKIVIKEFQDTVGAPKSEMLFRGEKFFKPITYRPREKEKYSMLRSKIPELDNHLPKIYETVLINKTPFLVMENLVYGYERPRVMSVQLGKPKKKANTCYIPYGVRFTGYTGYSFISRISVPQSYSDMKLFFKAFIKDKEIGANRYDVVPAWISQVQGILSVLSRRDTVKFKELSLLLIFDSAPNVPPKARSVFVSPGLCNEPKAPKVDHFMCFGLETLVKVMIETHQRFVSRHAMFLCNYNFASPLQNTEFLPTSNGSEMVEESEEEEGGGRKPLGKLPPISPEGAAQAEGLARRLLHENIQLIVSTPHVKSVQFARALSEEMHVRFVVDADLAALDFHDGDSAESQIIEKTTEKDWDAMCLHARELAQKYAALGIRVAVVSHPSALQATVNQANSKVLGFQMVMSLAPTNNDTWTAY